LRFQTPFDRGIDTNGWVPSKRKRIFAENYLNMEEVVWYSIPKFPTYEINEQLEVRHKVFKKIKSSFCDDGYLKINVDYQGKKYKPYLHQIVAWVFVPNPENKPEIHHIDCDSLNNHWTNLLWVTRAEHRLISKQNGQIAHKLKPADVVDIRNNYSGRKKEELALKYGVLPSTIYLIATGQSRQEVPGGIIHPLKGITKKVSNIDTGEVFKSVEEVSVRTGMHFKKLRRMLNGERYNNTPFRYLGEEYLSKEKPVKIKICPFIPYAFGAITTRKEYKRSKNPFAQWKRVIQYDLQGNEIAIHRSIREAARSVGAKDHKPLQKLLNGRGNNSFKKFKWGYTS
jgi:hypothetical protein